LLCSTAAKNWPSFFILFHPFPRCPSWALKWNINLKHWSHVENYFPGFPLRRILFPSRSRSTGWNFGCSHCIHILHADYMLWFPTARAATRSLVRKPLSKASFLFESRKERWQSQVRLLECRVFGFLGSSKKQLLNETTFNPCWWSVRTPPVSSKYFLSEMVTGSNEFKASLSKPSFAPSETQGRKVHSGKFT
jgi:hypothetical protein